MKKQYFGIKIQRINQKLSLLDYWKSESDIAKSGLIFDGCTQDQCFGRYNNSSKQIEFNLKNNEIYGKTALVIKNTMPIEFQETIILRLANDYIIEINKKNDTISDQILSTFKFTE